MNVELTALMLTMKAVEIPMTSTFDSDGSPNNHASTYWHDDAATLDAGSGEEHSGSNTEVEQKEIIDPEKDSSASPRRESHASYLEDIEAEDIEAQAAAPTQDPPSTTASHNGPKKVPRSQRRGWFARLVLIPEVEEPKDYERKTKWLITFIIAIGGIAAPFGSSIIFRKSFKGE